MSFTASPGIWLLHCAAAVVAATTMLYGCARSSDVTEQTLHDLAGGQYVRAESVARAQMERQIQQSGAASREVAVWSELLVRALLLNGRERTPTHSHSPGRPSKALVPRSNAVWFVHD